MNAHKSSNQQRKKNRQTKLARKNPTSAIRRGFMYQDTWGLLLCAKFLKDPAKYKWIQFETIPDDLEDGRFYLDDIIICDKSDDLQVYQIKRAQDPQDEWEWEDLLEKKRNRDGTTKDSLLEKWYHSFHKSERVAAGKFITNRKASKKINDCIESKKITLEKLEVLYPEILEQIKDQLGTRETIANFFLNFEFRFGQPDKDDIKAKARRILQQELGATNEGFLSLWDKLLDEAARRITEPLGIDQLREWCEWDIPKPLIQKFDVPADFVLFDEVIHKKIIDSAKNGEDGIYVFYGKPGIGKSTYLSELYGLLKKEKVITIRHHYHISPEDQSPRDRLNTKRVLEAIKAEIKQYPDEIKQLAYKNSENVSIREYLSKMAGTLHARGKSAVIIIDGLDHVLKYGDPLELKGFLGEIIFPQPGLLILIGTQIIAKEYLPKIVFDRCPEEDWNEIKGLTKAGIDYIAIQQNLIGLNLPDNTELRRKISEELSAKTSGNPLHLRYSLKQLKDRSKATISSLDVKNLLPYSGDIAKYYYALWTSLPEAGKTLAILITSSRFLLKEDQLLSVLRSIESYKSDPGKITEGFNSIAHLLEESKIGISLFHNSFEIFARKTDEYNQQSLGIKQKLKDWLETSEDEYLKWAELRILAYELGEPGALLSIDRNWLLDAISYPREHFRIISQLNLATKAAFEGGLLGKAFELSALETYFENGVEYVSETHDAIWNLALEGSVLPLSRIDLHALSTEQLRAVAIQAKKIGDNQVVRDAFDRLTEQLEDEEIRNKGDIGGHLPQVSKRLIEISVYIQTIKIERAFKYIIQFRDVGWSNDLFRILIKGLSETRQFAKAKKLISFDLTDSERRDILDTCAQFDLGLNSSYFLDDVGKGKVTTSNYCHLYLLLNGKTLSDVSPLPSLDSFPLEVKEYDEKREEHAKLFYSNFFLGIVYGLLGKKEDRKSTRLNSSHIPLSRMPSSA